MTLDVEYANKKMLYKPGSVKNTDTENVSVNSSSMSSHSSGANTKGCAFMKIESVNENSQQKNKFSSVLLIRVDSFAIALFVRGESYSSSESSNKSYMLYSILKMEKKTSSSSFEVKEGYSWFDKKLTNFNQLDSRDIYYDGSSSSSSKIPYIVVPNKDQWLDSSSSTATLKSYAGIWISENSSENSSENIFEGIKVQENSSTNGELLGSSNYEFSDSDAEYKKVKVTWDTSSKTWKKLSDANGKDVSQTLKSWFEVIKDNKGKWKSFEDYCNTFKSTFEDGSYKTSNSLDVSDKISYCTTIQQVKQ